MSRMFDEERREQAAAWIRAHGVDPGHIREEAKLYANGDGWDIQAIALDANGRKVYDKQRYAVMETIHITDDGNPPPAWLLP